MKDFRFDRWLKKKLYEKDMSVSDLSRKSGIPNSTLFYLINGSSKPTFSTFEVILDALDVHIELIDNEGE